jgi:hypothetical protein
MCYPLMNSDERSTVLFSILVVGVVVVLALLNGVVKDFLDTHSL